MSRRHCGYVTTRGMFPREEGARQSQESMTDLTGRKRPCQWIPRVSSGRRPRRRRSNRENCAEMRRSLQLQAEANPATQRACVDAALLSSPSLCSLKSFASDAALRSLCPPRIRRPRGPRPRNLARLARHNVRPGAEIARQTARARANLLCRVCPAFMAAEFDWLAGLESGLPFRARLSVHVLTSGPCLQRNL